MEFKVARGLALPSDAPVQTYGFFGRKGSGKTYAAGRLAESFLGRSIQIVILDWVGTWYGLRLKADGKGPSGFDIPVISGPHGDVPLDKNGGKIVAEFIVSTGSSVVLDISEFRKGDRHRFVTEFAETFFHLKKQRRSPVHLFLEEAQIYAPQRISDAREFGAVEDIVRLGRNYGIGCSMISQRPQSVNTEMRNQCEPLIVFQLVAKHERKAIAEWMEHMGVDKALAELSSLGKGDCFFWSPAWMNEFAKTRFLRKKTFDSSSTPLGEVDQCSLQDLTPVDLDKLQSAMSTAIEETKRTDPKILQGRIRDLERELQQRPADVDRREIDLAVNEAIIARDKDWAAAIEPAEKFFEVLRARMIDIRELAANDSEWADGLICPPGPFDDRDLEVHTNHRPPAKTPHPRRGPSKPSISSAPRNATSSDLPKGEAAVLGRLINHRPNGCTRTQLTVLTGYKRRTRDTYIQRLREKGFVEQSADRIVATLHGAAAMPDVEQLPTGAALRDWWQSRLPSGEWAVLDVLIQEHPHSVSRAEISERSGYANRRTRDTYIQRLVAKELVVIDGPGEVRASDTLF